MWTLTRFSAWWPFLLLCCSCLTTVASAQPSATPEPAECASCDPERADAVSASGHTVRPVQQAADLEEPPRLSLESERNISPWYGWQTLLVDAGSLTLFLAEPTGSAGTVFGLIGLAVGAPIVHWAHDHGGEAGLSLALRVVSMVVVVLGGFVLLGSLLEAEGHVGGLGEAVMVAGFAGLAATSILDAAYWSRARSRTHGDRSAHVVVAPWASTRSGSAGMQVTVQM